MLMAQKVTKRQLASRGLNNGIIRTWGINILNWTI
jgi:hypothetical protein